MYNDNKNVIHENLNPIVFINFTLDEGIKHRTKKPIKGKIKIYVNKFFEIIILL